MIRPTRRQLSLAALGAPLLLVPRGARAQTYPQRAITLVVASAAGGPIDATARVMARVMQRVVGQPVVVLNVPGAGGSLGVIRAAEAAPDGYTLLLGTPSDTVLAPLAVAGARSRPESLRLVARVQAAEYVLVTRPGLAFRDADDLIGRMRDPGSQLTYASFGHGAINHIATEEMLRTVGGTMLHVPVPGMATVINNLMGNQVDLCLMPVAGTTVNLIRERRLLPVFVASGRRHPQLPDVPSTGEIAAVRDFRLAIWLGLFAPAAVPDALASRLSSLMTEVVESDEYRRFSEDGGATVLTPAPVATEEAFYRAEIGHYRDLARSINLEAR